MLSSFWPSSFTLYSYTLHSASKCLRIYANGVQEVVDTSQNFNFAPLNAAAEYYTFGGGDPSNPSTHTAMAIDEFRVWRVLISTANILDAYTKNVHLPVDGLVIYFAFDEQAGASPRDDANLLQTCKNCIQENSRQSIQRDRDGRRPHADVPVVSANPRICLSVPRGDCIRSLLAMQWSSTDSMTAICPPPGVTDIVLLTTALKRIPLTPAFSPSTLNYAATIVGDTKATLIVTFGASGVGYVKVQGPLTVLGVGNVATLVGATPATSGQQVSYFLPIQSATSLFIVKSEIDVRTYTITLTTTGCAPDRMTDMGHISVDGTVAPYYGSPPYTGFSIAGTDFSSVAAVTTWCMCQALARRPEPQTLPFSRVCVSVVLWCRLLMFLCCVDSVQSVHVASYNRGRDRTGDDRLLRSEFCDGSDECAVQIRLCEQRALSDGCEDGLHHPTNGDELIRNS
jgi:hypothetical protein